MCRRIKVLRTLEPAVTRDDTRGRRDPSRTNEAAFDRAVTEIAKASDRLLGSLVSRAG